MQRLFVVFFFLFTGMNLQGLTLQEAVQEALDSNPVVQERLKNYRATREDLHIAESEYYPTLDLRLTYGHTNAGDLKTNDPGDKWDNFVEDKSYNAYESSLTFTYNLFNGFGTTNKIDYQEARLLAAAYNYIEKLNDIAFRMTGAYINLLKSYELVETAKENVIVNEDIYKRVKELYDGGLTSFSEVKKIEASLSLARSNLVVRMNNARDSEFNFKRILGRLVDAKELSQPTFDIPLPKSLKRATMYAIKHNPSLIVSKYNIKSAEALYRQSKKDLYPKIDLEVSQFYNDNDYTPGGLTGFDTPDDRFRARLVLNYNLYRGGADTAKIQKMVSKINQEVEIKRDLKRQVIEGLELSWSAYDFVLKQLKDLEKYKKFSDKTVELYKEEYSLGRRSLLDLLAAQNDAISAKIQIINAKYTVLFAKYRILDAMGLLPMAILGDTKEFVSKVNLYENEDLNEVLDEVPVKYDVDNDMIADDLDLCDNSILNGNILADGCKAHKVDMDGDGVEDAKDKCLYTPKGTKVDQNGCAIDADKDGVVDYKDKCLNTPLGYKVDQNGCAISTTFYGYFQKNSPDLPEFSYKNIKKLAQFLQTHPNYKAQVISYANKDTNKSASFYKKITQIRAQKVKDALVSEGVASKRIKTEALGIELMQYDPKTLEGRYKNNKIEVVFIK